MPPLEEYNMNWLFNLNRKYDSLDAKYPAIRFSIFLGIIMPIILIDVVEYKLPLLACLILMRGWYFYKCNA